jgi:hypothetical protein
MHNELKKGFAEHICGQILITHYGLSDVSELYCYTLSQFGNTKPAASHIFYGKLD